MLQKILLEEFLMSDKVKKQVPMKQNNSGFANILFGKISKNTKFKIGMTDLIFGVPTMDQITKQISYIVAANGIFTIRKNLIGIFGVPSESLRIADVEMPDKFFQLCIPKLPQTILAKTLAYFRSVPHIEAIVFVYYDKDNESYMMHVPEHSASGGSIVYDDPPLAELNRKYPKVMEIHSHTASMGAFWSGIDDSDEKNDIIYGVIGRVMLPEPELRLRVMVGGKAISVDLLDIFDDRPPMDDTYPQAWVTKGEATVVSGHHGYFDRQMDSKANDQATSLSKDNKAIGLLDRYWKQQNSFEKYKNRGTPVLLAHDVASLDLDKIKVFAYSLNEFMERSEAMELAFALLEHKMSPKDREALSKILHVTDTGV